MNQQVVTSSTRERIYLTLLIVGAVVPLAQFVPWLAANGLDVGLFLDELFVNRISSFFGWDVVISVTTLWTLAWVDRELTVRSRITVAAAALLGASVGLPMYLFLRERQRRLGGM